MSDTPANWFVQILFGRYQEQQPTISWTEVIILVVIGVVMAYLYLFVLRTKFHLFSTALANIPPTVLPLTPSDLSRRMYATLIDEMVRVDHITHHNLTPAPTTHPSDPGWGDAASHLANIHFTTSIAKSFILLESTALTRRPGLKHRGWRTVREYVQQLRKAFPGLRASLCDDYIRAYERSVFGEGKVGIDEYSEFMKVVYEMVGIINDRTWSEKAVGQVQLASAQSGASGATGAGAAGGGADTSPSPVSYSAS